MFTLFILLLYDAGRYEALFKFLARKTARYPTSTTAKMDI
jgi:hypothetical protein